MGTYPVSLQGTEPDKPLGEPVDPTPHDTGKENGFQSVGTD